MKIKIFILFLIITIKTEKDNTLKNKTPNLKETKISYDHQKKNLSKNNNLTSDKKKEQKSDFIKFFDKDDFSCLQNCRKELMNCITLSDIFICILMYNGYCREKCVNN